MRSIAGAARRDAKPDRPGCACEASDSFDVTSDSFRVTVLPAMSNILFLKRRKPVRQFNLKHGPWPARDCAVSAAPNARGWETLPEQGEEQERAAREWLRHLEAGHFTAAR
jgi:hypothetical protein